MFTYPLNFSGKNLIQLLSLVRPFSFGRELLIVGLKCGNMVGMKIVESAR